MWRDKAVRTIQQKKKNRHNFGARVTCLWDQSRSPKNYQYQPAAQGVRDESQTQGATLGGNRNTKVRAK